MEAVTYICPNCGAYLRYDGPKQKWVCDYCGSEYTKAELDRLLALLDAKEEAPKHDTTLHYAENVAKTPGAEEMHAYHCNACGAEIVTDATTSASFCVFCGNPVILPSQLSGDYLPSRILPFRNGKKDADAGFRNFCKKKPLLPKGFTTEARVQKITGLYVPFWVFDCHADFSYHAVGHNITTWSDSNYRYTKTDVYRIRRAGDVDLQNIPVDASQKMQDDMMDALEPYDIKQAEDFSMTYLSGFLSEKYTYLPKDLFPRLTNRVERGIQRAVEETVHYDSVLSVRFQNNLETNQQKYMLLPVWMLTSIYRGQTYMFSMNGQTGKMVGRLPYSKGKAALWFFGVLVISAVLLFLICSFLALKGDGFL